MFLPTEPFLDPQDNSWGKDHQIINSKENDSYHFYKKKKVWFHITHNWLQTHRMAEGDLKLRIFPAAISQVLRL